MNTTITLSISAARYSLLFTLLVALSPPVSSGIPASTVKPVVRGGAQILVKLGIGGLRRQLNRIYKRDEWKDVFQELVQRYLETLDKDTIPVELQRLSSTAIAANKGDAVAQRTLGIAYQNGKKVKRDFKKAGYWFSRAVEEEDGPSMIFLGRLFSRGIGVPQNMVGAYCLFHLAATHGESSIAQKEIKATRRRMNNAQLSEAKSCMK